MRTMTRVVALATVLAFVPATNVHSQAKAAAKPATSSSGEGFGLGYTDLGPVIGFGGLSYGGSVAIGGRFEHAIKAVPDMGNGMLGIQVGLSYYSSSQSGGGCSWNVSAMPIGGTVNYHFHMEEKKWDPFVGLGLGYVNYSAGSGCIFGGVNYGGSSSYNSGLFFTGRVGVRYFVSPKVALYGDLGAGSFGALNLGAMFKVGGK